MKIKSYAVQKYAGGKSYPLNAMIWLKDESNQDVANIRFYKDPNSVPMNDKKSASGFIACYCTSEQYPDYIDLLRNEAPIYLNFSIGNKLGYLSTLAEPVGDGEL